jgi:hypothetical protein
MIVPAVSASPEVSEAVKGVPLYAKIKRSSEHSHQHKGQPFPVQFEAYRGLPNFSNPKGVYCVRGNNNDYRIADLTFYVKVGEKFVALS